MEYKFKSILLLTLITALFSGCNQQDEEPAVTESDHATSAPAVQPTQKKTENTILVGNWERTDAPYQLKITELLDGGVMKAGYFNPKSINVAKALWIDTAGLLKVYVELRDENYPGSNYNLVYIPDRDLLAGKYYQAVEGQTYDVGFIRKK